MTEGFPFEHSKVTVGLSGDGWGLTLCFGGLDTSRTFRAVLLLFDPCLCFAIGGISSVTSVGSAMAGGFSVPSSSGEVTDNVDCLVSGKVDCSPILFWMWKELCITMCAESEVGAGRYEASGGFAWLSGFLHTLMLASLARTSATLACTVSSVTAVFLLIWESASIDIPVFSATAESLRAAITLNGDLPWAKCN